MKITAYHGTNEEFAEFQCPAYFTESFDTASFFARQRIGKDLVLQCTLKLQNPLTVNLDGQSWGGFFLDDKQLQESCVNYAAGGDAEEKAYFQEYGLTVNFLAEYAESLGHDSLIVHNCYEEDSSIGTQYVVFKPHTVAIESSKEI